MFFGGRKPQISGNDNFWKTYRTLYLQPRKNLVNMYIQLTPSTFAQLLAAILGLLTASILWNYSRSPHLASNKWLGASIFSLSCGLGVGFIVASGIALHFPHFFRTGNIFALAFMPFSYLYIRMVATRRVPSRWDLLHSLPMLFYIVDFLPFFLLPADVKLAMLQSDIPDLNKALSYDEGWITPPYAQLVIREIQILVYWLLEVRLLRGIYRLNIPVLEQENRPWLRWATVYAGIQSMMFLPMFVVMLSDEWGYIYLTNNALIALALVLLTLALFFQPVILYGIKGLIIYEVEARHPPTNSDVPVKNGVAAGIYLDYETVKTLQTRLETLMQTETPFLKQGYSSVDLANDLAIQPYQLSALLNHSIGANFNDYINERRIRFCLQQIKKGHWKGLTLEGIGFECGFSNRNTFTSSFKKFVGQAPSSYFSQWDGGDLRKN